jgi:hypothetical protein
MGTWKYVVALTALFALPANAALRYTEAHISAIETHETTIYLFLDVVSGDAPPLGNAGTNEPGGRPYLLLANSATDILNRKHELAAALVALTQGSSVRIRWDDAGTYANQVEYMLVRR